MLYVSFNDNITLILMILAPGNFNFISSHIVAQAIVETSFIEGLSHSCDSLTGDFRVEMTWTHGDTLDDNISIDGDGVIRVIHRTLCRRICTVKGKIDGSIRVVII